MPLLKWWEILLASSCNKALLLSLCGKFCSCTCAQYAKPKMSVVSQGHLIQGVTLVL